MIRAPDEYHTERLNNDVNHNSLKNISYTEQMKIAIELSRQEYSDEIEQFEEQQIIELHQEQCKIREKEISSILLKIKRVSKYDKDILDVLSILDDIFNQYKNGFIDCYYLNDSSHTIWKKLSQLRFTQEEQDILRKILK